MNNTTNYRKSIFINSSIILISRIIDLTTTHLAVIDFESQEQNLLVKIFHLNFYQFCLIDILLAFFLIGLNAYSMRKHYKFEIKSNEFYAYSKKYLYRKTSLKKPEFFTDISLKNVLILFGSIVPKYILFTSFLFSLNNYIIYLYINDHQKIIRVYDILNLYSFFDFAIFVLPIVILIWLLYSKLKKEFKL